jgi:LacI family transcriptional regulator
MDKRITIKDIAQLAGVSLGSVHCALSGKPGVSEATRQRIVQVAAEHGYRPNAIAASLKRKKLNIAAAIPALTGENRFFYRAIWEGVTDYINTLGDYNVELVSSPYYDDEQNSQVIEMQNLIERDDIHGIVSVGYTPTKGLISLQAVKEKQIPLVLVGNDVPDSGRLCCVLPNYTMVGRMMAEQMVRQIGPTDSILICAGYAQIPSNYLVVEGFESYLNENGFQNPVYKVHSSSSDAPSEAVCRLIEEKSIKGCCAVTARSSAKLGRVLEQRCFDKGIFSIGMDLFDETMDFLRRGVFGNVVQNHPYKSAYLATKILAEHLIKDIRPVMPTIHIGSEMVFKSNLPMYENGYYRLLM